MRLVCLDTLAAREWNFSGHVVVNQLSGASMSQDSVIPVANNAKSQNDLIERGFSRQPLRIDVEIARSLEALAHAAWSIPKDKYYEGGDRYRSLNRVRAEIDNPTRPLAM
jgi:hypothetical protein